MAPREKNKDKTILHIITYVLYYNQTTFSFLNQKFITNFNYLSANRPGVTDLAIGKVDRTYDSLQRETVHKIYADDNATSHLRVETAFEDVSGNKTTELVSGYSHYVGK